MNSIQINDIHMQLQVSTPIQVLSVLSTISTVIVIILVIIILRKNSNSTDSLSIPRIPDDVDKLFFLMKDWEFGKYKTLLSTFLLEDDCSVVDFLLLSLRDDNLTITDDGKGLKISGDGGWRNKHQISEATGLSSRKIYDKNGIIERLANLGFLEIRDKDGWGRQTAQYRVNINHALVKSMYAALLRLEA